MSGKINRFRRADKRHLNGQLSKVNFDHSSTNYCPLPISIWPLAITHCLLRTPIDHCPLTIPYCSLPIAHCPLPIQCRLLKVFAP